MIRVRLGNGTFLFGIDAENVRRLKKGQPIMVDLTTMGGTDTVAIMYGETAADIIRELEAATGQKMPVPTPLARDPKGGH